MRFQPKARLRPNTTDSGTDEVCFYLVACHAIYAFISSVRSR